MRKGIIERALFWRLLLGTAIVVALAGLCWLDAGASIPGIWLLPVALVVTVLATHEVLDLLAASGIRPIPWVVHLINLLTVTEMAYGFHWPSWMLARFPLTVLVLFIAEMCRYRKPGGTAANLAGSFFAWVYIGLLLSSAVHLRWTGGIRALIAWIVVVKAGDTGAYTFGRLLGRHKMAPYISPGKTVEGAIGGLICSCLGAGIVAAWPAQLAVPAPRWGWIVFGLVVGAAGMVGDLAESLLKRDAGQKDSSRWLPGFGGVLDIIDSLLLSAPVASFCWTIGLLGR